MGEMSNECIIFAENLKEQEFLGQGTVMRLC